MYRCAGLARPLGARLVSHTLLESSNPTPIPYLARKRCELHDRTSLAESLYCAQKEARTVVLFWNQRHSAQSDSAPLRKVPDSCGVSISGRGKYQESLCIRTNLNSIGPNDDGSKRSLRMRAACQGTRGTRARIGPLCISKNKAPAPTPLLQPYSYQHQQPRRPRHGATCSARTPPPPPPA